MPIRLYTAHQTLTVDSHQLLQEDIVYQCIDPTDATHTSSAHGTHTDMWYDELHSIPLTTIPQPTLAKQCTCTLHHDSTCPLPIHRRPSLIYNTVESVTPVQSTINVNDILLHQIQDTYQYSNLARALIHTGKQSTRAPCVFNYNNWCTYLDGYRPNDPCYPASVLLAGIQYGVLTRYEGDNTTPTQQRNHTPAIEHERDLVELIQQELRLGRYIGPFDQNSLPYTFYKISPLSLVEKASSKWRIINDLSSPPLCSVNDGIKWQSVQWQSIDDALTLIHQMGRSCHLLKVDIKAAYRTLPIHPSEWHLYGINVAGLILFDTYLPFGGRSSGCIWEMYAQAMQWMLHNKFNIPTSVRYVDDFLFILQSERSTMLKQTILDAFDLLGVPLDTSKTMGPQTVIPFIGYDINTDNMTISLTESHTTKLLSMIDDALHSSTQIQFNVLESLIGKLQWATKVYEAGKSYMYALQQQKNELVRRAGATRPLPTMQCYINSQARHELRWWCDHLLLKHSCNFDRHLPWPSTISPIHIYTDASEKYGCGAVYNNQFISCAWDDTVKRAMRIATEHRNMPLGEAIGAGLAITTFAEQLRNKHVIIHCDCTAVVHGINKRRSNRSPYMHFIFQQINNICVTNNIYIQCRHIPGIRNIHADNVSRDRVDLYKAVVLSRGMTAIQLQPIPIIITDSYTASRNYFPSH